VPACRGTTQVFREGQRSRTPRSFSLSATSQQYFSLRTNQPLATRQQYFSLRTNQHQPSATSQTNRLERFEKVLIGRAVDGRVSGVRTRHKGVGSDRVYFGLPAGTTAQLTKELTFGHKHSPNCDFYSSTYPLSSSYLTCGSGVRGKTGPNRVRKYLINQLCGCKIQILISFRILIEMSRPLGMKTDRIRTDTADTDRDGFFFLD
jgi:hypothetical protein